jgi:hypothetical protein
MIFPLVLLGCTFSFDDDCPTDGLDCARVAIRDAAGNPDGCDVSACLECVDACGEDCLVRESYPPQYACAGESWTVYDSCPAWDGLDPRATEVEDLGCGDGAEEIVASSHVAGRIDVVHYAYADGCCPESVRVDVSAIGTMLVVDYALVNDFCECICALDASYAIVDVPTGTWTLLSAASGVSAVVEVAP